MRNAECGMECGINSVHGAPAPCTDSLFRTLPQIRF